MTSIEQANSLYAAKPSNDLQDPRPKMASLQLRPGNKTGRPMPVAVSDEIDAANVRPLNKEDLARSSQNQRAGKAEAAEVTAHTSSQEIFRVITFAEHIIPHPVTSAAYSAVGLLPVYQPRSAAFPSNR